MRGSFWHAYIPGYATGGLCFNNPPHASVDASRASRRPAGARSSLRAAASAVHLGGASSRGYRSDLIGTNLHDRHHLEKDPFYESRVKQYTQPMKESKTVTVTGPAGQIGYSLLFRLAR